MLLFDQDFIQFDVALGIIVTNCSLVMLCLHTYIFVYSGDVAGIRLPSRILSRA